MNLLYIAAACALIGLGYAFLLTGRINKVSEGTERMKEIAGAIAEGARAFLFAEYRILAIFAVALFVLLFVLRGLPTAVCFVLGALLSVIAGYCGMNVATKANVRTANAARESGLAQALSVAFSGGAVMGLCVAGLGLLGVSVVYAITGNADILFGFSLGASSIALFARVGGGIYTKAADVGADLVGKVEAGIPEDDPRNPAVIADNVGDNVGDVAGMGADLFESYVGSIISAIPLGLVWQNTNSVVIENGAAIFPVVLAALVSSLLLSVQHLLKVKTVLHHRKPSTWANTQLISWLLSVLLFCQMYSSAASEKLVLSSQVLSLVCSSVQLQKCTHPVITNQFRKLQNSLKQALLQQSSPVWLLV